MPASCMHRGRRRPQSKYSWRWTAWKYLPSAIQTVQPKHIHFFMKVSFSKSYHTRDHSLIEFLGFLRRSLHQTRSIQMKHRSINICLQPGKHIECNPTHRLYVLDINHVTELQNSQVENKIFAKPWSLIFFHEEHSLPSTLVIMEEQHQHTHLSVYQPVWGRKLHFPLQLYSQRTLPKLLMKMMIIASSIIIRPIEMDHVYPRWILAQNLQVTRKVSLGCCFDVGWPLKKMW